METTGSTWKSYHVFLALLMVSTGTLNTLAAKWTDNMSALNKPFNHPFLQSLCMFVGELTCLPTFLLLRYFRRKRSSLDLSNNDERPLEMDDQQENKLNILIFLPATLCDMVATSIMYVGLTMTNASSFQMLRGATIIFTGIFSVAFLGVKLEVYKWLGMVLVLLGLVIVGLSDLLFGTGGASFTDPNRMISGDMLILIAQVIIAVQMVYEQKFVAKYNVSPLLAVGLEGFYGVILMIVVCAIFYFIKVPPPFSDDPEMRLENVLFAIKQINANNFILLPLLGLILSIAFFNFAGISVTKEMNATTRMVLDSIRVFFIWAISLAVGWQQFVVLQLFGFVVLLVGMFIFNDVLLRPAYLKIKARIMGTPIETSDP